MTWERLLDDLDDLEQQAAGAFAAERGLEVEERARSVYAEVTLGSRLMAGVGATVGLRLTGVGELSGRLVRVGDGWCLLAVGEQEWLVPWPSVLGVRGLPGNAVPPEAWPVTARLGLGAALRHLAEDGAECEVRLTDGGAWSGRLGRVGADFVEVLPGEARSAAVVGFPALAAVGSRSP